MAQERSALLPLLPPQMAETIVDPCCICQETPILPRKLDACGHGLCTTCLGRLLQSAQASRQLPQCPLCRKEYIGSSVDEATDTLLRKMHGDSAYLDIILRTTGSLFQVACMRPQQLHYSPAMQQRQHIFDQDYEMELRDYHRRQRNMRIIELLTVACNPIALFCAIAVIVMASSHATWGLLGFALGVIALATFSLGRMLPRVRTQFGSAPGSYPERRMVSMDGGDDNDRYGVVIEPAHRMRTWNPARLEQENEYIG